ncbi:MAG TPA: hypothetical protein VM305_04880 [Candidatus Limnocylindrales bacterium]|nr:hypothetical protein [Candidatus Limnocylindrales bacterium]
MSPEQVVSALIGAFFGAAGWLVVGLYMQRRQHHRQARSAARAVYFELAVNRIDVDVALRHGVYQPLSRASFERLLPELATWLTADELDTLARAYMSHAGYQQLERDASVPQPVRLALLERILAEHDAASAVLRTRAFSTRDAARLARSDGTPLPAPEHPRA